MQPITFPESCPACNSGRAGIQEKKAFFHCGTVATITKGGLRWTRPYKCVIAARKIQAGQNGQGKEPKASAGEQVGR